MPFSTVAVPFCSPINNGRGSNFSTSTDICHYLFFYNSHPNRYEMVAHCVMICFSLVIIEVEYLVLIGHLDSNLLPIVNCIIFLDTAYILHTNCMHFLDINLLPANDFQMLSPYCKVLFHFLIVSFDEQRFFIFMMFSLFICFSFGACTLDFAMISWL